MKDILGNELHEGDTVVYVVSGNLYKGTIKKIYKDDKGCTVNSNPHVYPYRIAKI